MDNAEYLEKRQEQLEEIKKYPKFNIQSSLAGQRYFKHNDKGSSKDWRKLK